MENPKTRITARQAVLLGVILALIPTHGWGAETTIAVKSGSLSLDGKSTLHAFTATTTDIQVRSAVDATAPVAEWSNVLQPGTVRSFEVEIPVLSLKSDKDGLDKRMYKALKSEQHQSIVLRVVHYTAEPAKGEVMPLKVSGTLTVAGVERPIELTLETQRTAEGLAVVGRQNLLMTDFGIKPPSMMLGTIKTRNEIAIRFSLVFALSHS